MRLIDAEELERLFNEQVERGAADLFDAFDDALQDTPTVDAVPVVHGRWIVHKPSERHNLNKCIECSECNTWFGHDCYAKTDFCPNCGAKMDGGADGDE